MALLRLGGITSMILSPLVSVVRGEETRTIYFNNFCQEDVWVKFTPGAAPYAEGKTSCASSGDCIEHAECNLANSICFWKVPVPSTSTYRLDAFSGQSNVSFPISESSDVVWSGNIRACKDGTCENTTTECDAAGCSVEGPSPVTLTEFTLSKTNVDFYDISILNGYNIAVEMAPVPPFSINESLPYNCGNPGGSKSVTGAGACSWLFDPPSREFRWVRGGNEDAVSDCIGDTDCERFPGTVCGMSNTGAVTCGELLGYWSLDQFCGQHLDEAYPSAQCRAPLPYPNEGQTLWNLLGCVDVPSCYQAESGNNCCGCVDWQNEIEEVSPLTELCLFENPNWLSYVKPSLSFLKHACPSAYTYPYDDHSSTYVCSSKTDDGVNRMEYSINFCPQ